MQLWDRVPPTVRRSAAVAFALVSLALPFMVKGYLARVAVIALLYIVMAQGMNIIIGYAGIFNIGYVAYYMIGAYTYALLASQDAGRHWPFWLLLILGPLLAVLFGVLMAVTTSRLRGDYLALATLGYAEMLRLLVNNLDRFTFGPKGVTGLDTPQLFGLAFSHVRHFYYLAWLAAAGAVWLAAWLKRRPIGLAWAAMRDDEDAAETAGMNTLGLKLKATMIGAGLGGLAGVIYAASQGFVAPESFLFDETVTIICMVVLGGLASVPGAALGGALLILLPEYLRAFSDYRMLLYGLAFVLLMNFRPEGLLPDARVRREMRR